jgi:DNA-binding MarR family transcriptional regulator
VTKLAGQVGPDQSTVSRQLQGLEQLRLVRRALDTGDQRIRKVVVTAAGRRAWHESLSRASNAFLAPRGRTQAASARRQLLADVIVP